MLRRSLAAVALVAAACGGGSSQGPSGEGLTGGPRASGVGPRDAGLGPRGATAAVDAGMPDAGMPDAGIDAPPPLVIPTVYVPAKGKRTTLRERETKAVGHGLRVTFAHQGHKHLVGGGAVGFYELSFARAGKTSDARLSTHEDDLEAELDALGVLVVVTTDGGTITIATVGKTPRPLDEDRAAELIEEAAARHGLPVGGSSQSFEEGVLRYVAIDGTVERWRARIGLYTRRIWFLPPRPPEP